MICIAGEYDSALSVYAKMAAEAREIVRARGLKRGNPVIVHLRIFTKG